MFPLDVLAEGHLEEGEAHVKGLHDVALPRQGVVPPGRLTPRHLALHGGCEGRVEMRGVAVRVRVGEERVGEVRVGVGEVRVGEARVILM